MLFRNALSLVAVVCIVGSSPGYATAATSPGDEFCGSVTPLVPDVSVTKRIDRTFPVNATGDLKLDNRYGDIVYRVGTAREVTFAIVITAAAGSERKAQEILDKLSVDFVATKSIVSARTHIEGGGANGFQVMSFNSDSKKKGFTIDYLVTAPAGFALDAKNRFGDIELASTSARTRVDLQYGDLRAGDLGALSSVDIGFGKGVIGRVGSLDAKVKYGGLTVNSAGEAKVYARFSELDLGRMGDLTIDSEYGNYTVRSARTLDNRGDFNDLRIDSAWSLRLSGGYNDVKVRWLGTDADFEMTFGDVHVDATSAKLANITFLGSYTTFTAAIHERVQYALTAEAKYGEIRTPRAMVTTQTVSKTVTERVEGHVGSQPTAVVKLTSSYGDLVLR